MSASTIANVTPHCEANFDSIEVYDKTESGFLMGWDVPWDPMGFSDFFPSEKTSSFLLKHEFKILYTRGE